MRIIPDINNPKENTYDIVLHTPVGTFFQITKAIITMAINIKNIEIGINKPFPNFCNVIFLVSFCSIFMLPLVYYPFDIKLSANCVSKILYCFFNVLMHASENIGMVLYVSPIIEDHV